MRPLFHAVGAAALLAVAAPFEALALDLPGPVVEPEWLHAHLGVDGLVVLDVRGKTGGATREDYLEAHIPSAVYSDYGDGWRVERDGIVGLVPEEAALEDLIGGLGIERDDAVVVVHGGANSTDFGAAARVYWTLKYAGHDAAAILNGGQRAWTADPNRPLEAGANAPQATTYDIEPREDLLVMTGEVEAGLGRGGATLIDARPLDFFAGARKHAAAGAPGRLPGALGLDQGLFIDPETGRLKDQAAIEALVPARLEARRDERLVSYCNTGHWAATDWFVLSEVLGYPNVALYDASMVGWTADPGRPIETGKDAVGALGRWLDQKLDG